jgi:fused signal recognition particle receptor
MFGKLKDKLKSWLKSSKETVEETAPKKEIEVTEKPKKEKKKEKKPKKEKKVEEMPEAEEETEPIKTAEEVKEEEIKRGVEPAEKLVEEKKSFFKRIKSSFSYKITEDEFDRIFDDLDMLLLENNVALEVVEDIKRILSGKLVGKEISKDRLEEEIKKELKNTLNEILIEPDDITDIVDFKEGEPLVILFFGINGTGKTTSIAKLAHLFKKKGSSVLLAAADTFRAASIEQIAEHAKKLDVPLIKHDYGSDPSAVGFDAIKYAKSHKIDVVLIDTAGRMHTKANLLAEMEKIVRVTKPDLKIFVAESIAGNDAVEQAKAFHEAVEINGSILSKADIDEKGGTILSIGHATKKPIFYLGTGQKYTDLELFDKQKFIENLGL